MCILLASCFLVAAHRTGILAFALGRCARFLYSTEISGRRRCRRSSALLRRTPLRALTKTARCSALQTRAQQRIQNCTEIPRALAYRPLHSSSSAALSLLVQLLRMDAKHVVQKAHQEMSHLKRHFLVVVFAELAEQPAKDVRAHPHAQHVSSATAMDRCQRLNCTLLSSLDSPQEDPVISTDITDNRQNFLGQCQMSHWQFSTLRHAQYASLAHPARVKSAAKTWRALSWRSAQSHYLNPVFVFHLRYSTMMILNHIHNKPSYCIDTCQRGRVEDGSFMVSFPVSIPRPFARCLTRPRLSTMGFLLLD